MLLYLLKVGEVMKYYTKTKYCIHCKKPSNNFPYCYECYNKYYKISNESYRMINDSSYPEPKHIKQESTYKLYSGIEVKSKSEFLISTFLQSHRIGFAYEKPLYYEQGKKPLYPDFYIEGPRYFRGKWLKNVYIEHFGGAKSNNPNEQTKYNNIVKYKIPIYQKLNITVICTYEEDIENLDYILTEKLKNFKENSINYLKES